MVAGTSLSEAPRKRAPRKSAPMSRIMPAILRRVPMVCRWMSPLVTLAAFGHTSRVMGLNRRIVELRTGLMSALVTALALAACATPPPQARAAQERLHAGDLRGAEAAIDEGLVQH